MWRENLENCQIHRSLKAMKIMGSQQPLSELDGSWLALMLLNFDMSEGVIFVLGGTCLFLGLYWFSLCFKLFVIKTLSNVKSSQLLNLILGDQQLCRSFTSQKSALILQFKLIFYGHRTGIVMYLCVPLESGHFITLLLFNVEDYIFECCLAVIHLAGYTL